MTPAAARARVVRGDRVASNLTNPSRGYHLWSQTESDIAIPAGKPIHLLMPGNSRETHEVQLVAKPCAAEFFRSPTRVSRRSRRRSAERRARSVRSSRSARGAGSPPDDRRGESRRARKITGTFELGSEGDRASGLSAAATPLSR